LKIFHWRSGLDPASKVKALNILLASFAKENNHSYLNYYDSMATDEGATIDLFTTDGFHVTTERYKHLETLARTLIDDVLRKL